MNTLFSSISRLAAANSIEPITLVICSEGGSCELGNAFYESYKCLYEAPLRTIGMSSVASSAVKLFLTGDERYLVKGTRLMIHEPKITPRSGPRSIEEMEYYIEDLKPNVEFTVSVLEQCSQGKLHGEPLREMLRRQTLISAEDAVEYGLAHEVIGHV